MKARKIAAIFLFALCLAAVVLCSFPEIFPWEERTTRLVCDALPRFLAACFLLVVLWGSLCPPRGNFLRSSLWCLPCLAVAFANFPFTALISGSARLDRLDLLWLFWLKCLSVALMEELFFRALLIPVLRERLEKTKGGFYWSVLLSAALFSLMHLVNLFYGASFGATALQIGYTFLLGTMFGVMYCVTKNIWMCVCVHTIFDIGGLIVTDLGTGPFQDTVFWILTAAAGVICAAHILLSAYFYQKKEGQQDAA